MGKSEHHDLLAELEQKREDLEEKVQDLTRQHKTTRQTLQRMSRQVIKSTHELFPATIPPAENFEPTRCSERVKLVVAPPIKPARKRKEKVVDPNQLVELKKKQHGLEVQTEAISRELKDVQHALNTVSLQVITLTNELAPITSLPTEILGAIFAIARNFTTLGQVIRRWREIVNETPQFWSTTRFAVWNCNDDAGKAEHQLSLALKRSRQFPLDANFHLLGDEKYYTWTEERYTWIEEADPVPTTWDGCIRYPSIFLARHLKALMPHASRIRSITIETEWHEALYQVLTAFLDVDAPLLESIVIDMADHSSYDVEVEDLPKPFDFLKGGAPMLKSIELTNLAIPHCSLVMDRFGSVRFFQNFPEP